MPAPVVRAASALVPRARLFWASLGTEAACAEGLGVREGADVDTVGAVEAAVVGAARKAAPRAKSAAGPVP